MGDELYCGVTRYRTEDETAGWKAGEGPSEGAKTQNQLFTSQIKH